MKIFPIRERASLILHKIETTMTCPIFAVSCLFDFARSKSNPNYWAFEVEFMLALLESISFFRQVRIIKKNPLDTINSFLFGFKLITTVLVLNVLSVNVTQRWVEFYQCVGTGNTHWNMLLIHSSPSIYLYLLLTLPETLPYTSVETNLMKCIHNIQSLSCSERWVQYSRNGQIIQIKVL